MKILTSSYYLDLSGVPTYTLTMFRELRRRGHDVRVYTVEGGALETYMNVVRDGDTIPTPDVIIAQHNECARRLYKLFPDVPMIFSAHGVLPQGEQPPDDAFIKFYTAINEDGVDHLISRGIPASKIEIVRDFVDTHLFQNLLFPINERPHRVLYISNRRRSQTYFTIEEACKRLLIPFRAVGAPYGRLSVVDLPNVINHADVVIGSGRAILEAMSVARAVISLDQNQGDGYLDGDTYYESRRRNFAGANCRYQEMTVDDLIREFTNYRQTDSILNRDLVLRFHNVEIGVNQLLDLVERVA
jgi:O-antigen biosynthesis protein